MAGRRLVLLIAASSLLLGACERASLPFSSGPTPAASPVPTEASTPSRPEATPRNSPAVPLESLKGTQLTLWHAFPPAVTELLNAQVVQFNAQNPWGITVRAEAKTDYATLFDEATASLSTPDRPDLAAALPEQIRAWNSDGFIADLAPNFGDPENGFSADEQAEFPAAFLEQDREGEKLLALPAERSARMLFYNETWGRLLDFSGIPQTPTDFTKQACAGNAAFRRDGDQSNDGFGGWIVDSDYQTVLAWMLGDGGGVFSGGAYSFDTSENESTLEFIKGLYDTSCAWISSEPETYDQFARRLALFSTGDLSELDAQAAAFSRASPDTADDRWTVAAFPGSQEQSIVAYGPSYAVIKSTPEKELASWLFVRWLLDAEHQAQWVRATGLFPLRTSEMPLLADYASAHPQWEAAVGLLGDAHAVPPAASWRTMKYVLGDGAEHIFRVNLPVTQIPGVLKEMDATAAELQGK
jgi:multiple sugar transport system substrate-binding protein